jgi:hypothetical protein
VLWFGLVVLTTAVSVMLPAATAGRRPGNGTLALALGGLVLTLEGMRQPRESLLFGGLLVVLAFGGLLLASLSMAVGPGSAAWIPGRRGAFAWTVAAVLVMAVGFGVVPPTPGMA